MGVGLDVGSRYVKVVEVAGTKEKPKLLHAGIAEVHPTPSEELEPGARVELLTKAVKHALGSSGIRPKRVAVSLTGDAVVVRLVKFPVMSKSEMKNALQFEAEQYIPLKVDQVVLDFHVVREVSDEGQKKNEVILVAAKNEAVEELLQLLSGVGCEPHVIDCDTFGVHNCFEHNYGATPGETSALVHIGARVSTLSIVEDGLMIFTRDIPMAGNHVTKEIERGLSLDFVKAEQLKKTQGQLIIESEEQTIERLPDKEDQTLRIFEAILPTMNKFVAELRRSLDFYEAQAQKRTITRVALSGGGTLLKNLVPFLSEKLKMPVEYHEPFKQIELAVPPEGREALTAGAAQYTVALGLALRTL